MWTPKVGEFVAACCDGKWSRAVDAMVIGVGGGGNWVNIRFVPWAAEDAGLCTLWCERKFYPRWRERNQMMRRGIARRRRTVNQWKEHHSPKPPADCFGGWLSGDGELGILRGLGCCSDWYSIYDRQVLVAEGCTPAPYLSFHDSTPREGIELSAADLCLELSHHTGGVDDTDD